MAATAQEAPAVPIGILKPGDQFIFAVNQKPAPGTNPKVYRVSEQNSPRWQHLGVPQQWHPALGPGLQQNARDPTYRH